MEVLRDPIKVDINGVYLNSKGVETYDLATCQILWSWNTRNGIIRILWSCNLPIPVIYKQSAAKLGVRTNKIRSWKLADTEISHSN